MIRLYTLGTLAVEGPSGPVEGAPSQPKALALLALLAGGAGRGVSRDRLACHLWPESPGGKVSHRLTQLVYSLRRDLGVEDLFEGTASLRLNPRAITSDLADFTAAMETGDFAAAADWYRGPFLEGFYLKDAPEFERWAEAERERLAERYRAALDSLVRGAEQRQDLTVAAGWRRQLIKVDPFNAEAVCRYLENLDRLGDRTGAIRYVESYQAMLRAEFDAAPDPSILAIAERLRATPSGARSWSEQLPPAVAVLPFTNLTPDHENQYFADGMSEEVTNALSRVRGLRVASQLAARRFRNSTLDPQALALELGVAVLIAGSVRKVGNRIRLSVQVVDGADGRQLWSETWDRTLEDVFALQDEVSRAIVSALSLPTPAPSRQGSQAPRNIDAYTLYLRGRHAALKRNQDGLAIGFEYFEQATELDPLYALAHAGIAESLVLQGFPEFGQVAPLKVMPKAKRAAAEALRLDPWLPEAHTWLGVIHFLYDWDWESAEASFRRSLQLQPEDAFAEVWYAVFLSAMGRHDEAIRHVMYGEALEPASPQIRLCVPRVLHWAGKFEAALASARDLWRSEPGLPLAAIWLSRCLAGVGRHEEAAEALSMISPAHRTPYSEGIRACHLAALGRREEASDLIHTVEDSLAPENQGGVISLAEAYARLGGMEQAKRHLTAAEQARNGVLAFMAVDTLFDPMRGTAWFREMQRRLGLPSIRAPVTIG